MTSYTIVPLLSHYPVSYGTTRYTITVLLLYIARYHTVTVLPNRAASYRSRVTVPLPHHIARNRCRYRIVTTPAPHRTVPVRYRTSGIPLPSTYYTVTVPLPYRYPTVTVSLPYRGHAVTVTLPYRYRTVTLPYRYRTVTVPLPYCYHAAVTVPLPYHYRIVTVP